MRNQGMNHQHIEELLPAAGLGILSAEEQAQVTAHVQECEVCRHLQAQYNEIGEGLLYATPPVEPPPHLRARLLAATGIPAETPTLWQRLRSTLRQVSTPALTLTVLFLAIVNIALLVNTRSLMQQQQALLEQTKTAQTALALLAYPDAQVLAVEQNETYGVVVYVPELSMAVMNLQGLSPLPASQAYQVWLIEPDGERVSGGLIHPEQDTDEFISLAVHSPEPFSHYTGLGITIEPREGSPGPTGAKVFGVDF